MAEDREREQGLAREPHQRNRNLSMATSAEDAAASSWLAKRAAAGFRCARFLESRMNVRGPASEGELQRGLHQSRGSSVHHLTEKGSINSAVDSRRAEELSVIEGVERFQPEF